MPTGKQDKSNGEVAEVQPADLVTPSPFQLLLRDMTAMATLDESEKRITGEDINPILLAETEEEMWDSDELPRYNAKILSGCELQLLGFDVKYGSGNNEDIKTPFVTSDGKQMYLLVQAVRISDTGDHKKEYRLPDIGVEFTMNTSARNIVGKLFWMLRNGWFDRGHSPVYTLIKGTPLGAGKSVEKLKPLPGITVTQKQAEEVPF